MATMAPARAGSDDDLSTQREKVASRIERVTGALDDVSRELVEATAVLRQTQSRLADARGELTVARAEVVTAQLADEQMQRRLVAAEQRLSSARDALALGRKRVVRQRNAVAQLAVSQYQGESSELMNLSAALNANSPQDLSSQIAALGDVLDHSSATLDGLQATRLLLAVQQRRVLTAKQDVADRRAAAAAELRRTQEARTRATQARDAVVDLVHAQRDARVAAHLAVVSERQRLGDLRRERDRISSLLAARARRQALLQQVTLGAFHGKSNGFLSFPVEGPVTSPFGMRTHPILNIVKLHDGTDFGAPCGTPIHAAAPGKVIEQSYNAGYGSRLIVDDGFVQGVSLATSYNHLAGYAVQAGEHVERGQVVGYVGSTGFSTGCHLHFMVYENGLAVDPLTWF